MRRVGSSYLHFTGLGELLAPAGPAREGAPGPCGMPERRERRHAIVRPVMGGAAKCPPSAEGRTVAGGDVRRLTCLRRSAARSAQELAGRS